MKRKGTARVSSKRYNKENYDRIMDAFKSEGIRGGSVVAKNMHNADEKKVKEVINNIHRYKNVNAVKALTRRGKGTVSERLEQASQTDSSLIKLAKKKAIDEYNKKNRLTAISAKERKLLMNDNTSVADVRNKLKTPKSIDRDLRTEQWDKLMDSFDTGHTKETQRKQMDKIVEACNLLRDKNGWDVDDFDSNSRFVRATAYLMYTEGFTIEEALGLMEMTFDENEEEFYNREDFQKLMFNFR